MSRSDRALQRRLVKNAMPGKRGPLHMRPAVGDAWELYRWGPPGLYGAKKRRARNEERRRVRHHEERRIAMERELRVG